VSSPRTLFAKIWDDHVVAEVPGGPSALYIDLHLVHEVTSPQAFAELARRGLGVRRPDRTVATMDHSIPTVAANGHGRLPLADAQAQDQMRALARACAVHGIELHGDGDPGQGIVHVIGPERGVTRPGMTIVCGDSHTSTHGAFGALAFGIGTSQVAHVLATQCLLAPKPKTLEVVIEGELHAGVTAKDIILALIAKIGAGGATGHVIEYRGRAIRGLSMEGRMTVCNMSIEAGARAGLVAPDDVTFEFLKATPTAPRGAAWDAAVARWRTLATDEGAAFDRSVSIDAAALAPMITWGTTPAMGCAIDAPVPDPAAVADPDERAAARRALDYMKVAPGRPLVGTPVDVVFIGSCTNSRLTDLRDAARVLEGRQVAAGVRALVVPGSQEVKRRAEAEGLDQVFRAAGAEWREPGCSMCIAMNGDELSPGQLAVSTSNRNFEGRQGKGGRTVLASPLTAAAAAVAGHIADPRPYLASDRGAS